jgi:hypothetical protein
MRPSITRPEFLSDPALPTILAVVAVALVLALTLG